MRKRHSILCVDADGFGLQVRRLVLECAGHRVFAFTRPDEALRELMNRHIDAVMLDRELEEQHPGTARAFKSLQPAIPVLLLSNRLYSPASATRYIDAILTKGEAPDRLLSEIDHAVNKTARQQHRIRPLLWASGVVATGAAWFAARALHRRWNRDEVGRTKKPPHSEKPHATAKSARA